MDIIGHDVAEVVVVVRSDVVVEIASTIVLLTVVNFTVTTSPPHSTEHQNSQTANTSLDSSTKSQM